jgi:Protein of unknown function (DUF2490)
VARARTHLEPALSILAILLMKPVVASAQTNTQFWGNVTLNWLKGSDTTLGIDVEPKILVSAPADQPHWWEVEVTPSIEYAVRRWVNLLAEMKTSYTKQTDDDNTFELTTRVGTHFHVFSRDVPTTFEHRPIKSERPPRRRLVIRDLVRVEQRNLFHTVGGTDSSWRFRNRIEFQFPLNRAKITNDGAHYLLSDWEWFIPLDDPKERFANRQRIRAGLGYRHSVHWRFEALYIWTRSRDTTSEPFTTSDNIVNFRLKRVF